MFEFCIDWPIIIMERDERTDLAQSQRGMEDVILFRYEHDGED
jgi:hypothetical protein